MQIHEAFAQLAAVLDEMELPFAVGGSVASSAFGIARATQDIDLIVDLSPDDAFALAARLEKQFAVDPDDARRKIGLNQSFNLIHAASVSKFDIFPVTFFAHGRKELSRRRLMTGTALAPDDDVPIVSPEDIILAKLAWYRLGNEKSERQWGDLESVWQISGAKMDRAYLEEWAGTMGTHDLLRKLTGWV
jgi:hypothetical protein